MKNIEKILKAISKINPDAEMCIRGDDIDTCTIEWSNTAPISKEDIKVKMSEVQSEYDALNYARARAVAYPSLQEFAEAYCEKEIDGSSAKWDAYKTAYNKVRTDNPKE